MLLRAGEFSFDTRGCGVDLFEGTLFEAYPRQLNVDHSDTFIELCRKQGAPCFLQHGLGFPKAALVDEDLANIFRSQRTTNRVAGAQVEFAAGAQPLDRLVPATGMRVEKAEVRADVRLHTDVADRFEDRERLLQVFASSGAVEGSPRKVEYDQRAAKRLPFARASRFVDRAPRFGQCLARTVLAEQHHCRE